MDVSATGAFPKCIDITLNALPKIPVELLSFELMLCHWFHENGFLCAFRPRCSTGDPKRLDSPSALAPPTHSLPRQGDAEPQGMRRRANTFSHSPIPPSAEYSLGYTPKTQKAATSASSKLIRHYSVSSDTPHQSKYGSICHPSPCVFTKTF